MPFWCCVPGCMNTNDPYTTRKQYKFYEGKFYKFPENPERRAQWNEALHLTGNKVRYVCAAHFANDAWRVCDVIMNVPISKRRLKSDAVPTLNISKTVQDNGATIQTTTTPENKAEADSVSRECQAMDDETRKRLVAEALADYEEKMKLENKSQSNRPLRSCVIRSNKRKCPSQDDMMGDDLDNYSKGSKTTNNKTVSNCLKAKDLKIKSQKLKCGEILVDIDEHTFSIHCSLCNVTSLSLEDFVQHIQARHNNMLNPLQIVNGQHLKSGNQGIYGSHATNHGETQKTTAALDLQNVPLMEALIRHYKDQRLLWDKTHPYNAQAQMRQKSVINILHSLLSEFPLLPLTLKNVNNLLHKLRGAYRVDRRGLTTARSLNMVYKAKYWFFEKLQFLEETSNKSRTTWTIDEREREKLRKTAEQVPYDMSDLEMESQLIDIIEMYEQQPCLWQIDDSHHDHMAALQDFLKQLLTKYPDHYIKTSDQLKAFLDKLHNWFSAVEQLRLEASGNHEKYEPRSPVLYSALEFLQGHVAPFNCHYCQLYFGSEDAFKEHTSLDCSIRLKEFKPLMVHECSNCSKRFSKAAALKRHVRMHTNERPYVCNTCDQRFRNYSTLFRHRRVHNKVKPHKCVECNRCYYTLGLLRMHQKSHLNIRDQICDICGKGYMLAKHLHRHKQMVHTKPNQSYCPKPLQYQSELSAEPLRANHVKTIMKVESKGCGIMLQLPSTNVETFTLENDDFYN